MTVNTVYLDWYPRTLFIVIHSHYLDVIIIINY